MKIKFYGTRGSTPIADKDFLEFGGNTTSIRIDIDNGRTAIFDAGSGIRKLGMDLIKEGFKQDELFISFSHFHWDHIQGFPFFDPAYDSNVVLNLLALGKNNEIESLEKVFKNQMKSEYFPVPLNAMGAKFNFMQLNENQVTLKGSFVKVIKQNHPGGSYGYRLENSGKALVICTDLEHEEQISEDFIDFCKGADLLIHDAQYTTEELKLHKGWGHSSFSQAMEVAKRAGVKQLAMTHHDPEHNDAFLRKMEQECQKRMPNCVLAREGMEIVL